MSKPGIPSNFDSVRDTLLFRALKRCVQACVGPFVDSDLLRDDFMFVLCGSKCCFSSEL